MTSDDESIRMSGSEARRRGRDVSAAFCRDVARSGWLFAGLLVAGLLSCNSLLGIGEASLQCDANPCATDVAAGGAGDARNDGAASSDTGGAGGSSGAGAGVATAVGSAETRDGLPIDRATPPAGEASAGSGSESSDAEGSEGGASGGDKVDAAVPAGQAGTSSDPVGGGGAPANRCESGDACGDCLCVDCESEVALCNETVGCFEIVACARINGCTGLDCYCGSALPIACATGGQANGPCLDAALAAPGSRLPTLANPSAGPAADAALEIANCTLRNCAASCGN
jgi:hypothetical protein